MSQHCNYQMRLEYLHDTRHLYTLKLYIYFLDMCAFLTTLYT